MDLFLTYSNLLTVLIALVLSLIIYIKIPASWGTRIVHSMLFIMGFRSLVYFSFQVEWFPTLPNLIGLSAALQFLSGYGLWLYIGWIEYPKGRPDFSWYHWFVPIFAIFTIGIPNLIQDQTDFKSLNYNEAAHALDSLMNVKWYVIIWALQNGFYLLKILSKIKGYPEKDSLKNSVFFIFLIIGLFASRYFMYVGSLASNWFNGNHKLWMHSDEIFKPLFLIGLFLVCYRNPILIKPSLRLFETQIFPNEAIHIWKRSLPTNSEVAFPHQMYKDLEIVGSITNKIEEWVQTQKPFRDPNFSIEDLAHKINLPVSHLRFLFKEFNELSFNDYRNFCRVQDLEELFIDSSKNHLSVELQGEICGFGSKSAMYRAVRRHFDLTPQELQFQLTLNTKEN